MVDDAKPAIASDGDNARCLAGLGADRARSGRPLRQPIEILRRRPIPKNRAGQKRIVRRQCPISGLVVDRGVRLESGIEIEGDPIRGVSGPGRVETEVLKTGRGIRFGETESFSPERDPDPGVVEFDAFADDGWAEPGFGQQRRGLSRRLGPQPLSQLRLGRDRSAGDDRRDAPEGSGGERSVDLFVQKRRLVPSIADAGLMCRQWAASVTAGQLEPDLVADLGKRLGDPRALGFLGRDDVMREFAADRCLRIRDNEREPVVCLDACDGNERCRRDRRSADRAGGGCDRDLRSVDLLPLVAGLSGRERPDPGPVSFEIDCVVVQDGRLGRLDGQRSGLTGDVDQNRLASLGRPVADDQFER